MRLDPLGYVAAIQEMMGQFQNMALTPDYIVAATGSGVNALAGLILEKTFWSLKSDYWRKMSAPPPPIFIKNRHIVREFCERYQVDINVEKEDYRIIDGYVGAGYALSRPQEREFIVQVAYRRHCARYRYTGKALYGLTQEIQKGDV